MAVGKRIKRGGGRERGRELDARAPLQLQLFEANSQIHRRGNRGSRGSSYSPNKVIGGASNTSCSPNFLLNQSGSIPVRCFISWKAPEDRCYSATRGEIFILKFTKCRLVAGLGPDRLGREGGKYQFLLPQPKNRSRAYAQIDNTTLLDYLPVRADRLLAHYTFKLCSKI